MSDYEDWEIASNRHADLVGWLQVIAASVRNTERIAYVKAFGPGQYGDVGNSVARPPRREEWESDAKPPL